MMHARRAVCAVLFGLAVSAAACAGQVLLSDVPDYEWWYGCSPTSAGMLMGYYDINGYNGETYENLVPGGTAPLDTFVLPGDNIANHAIASTDHQDDFYVSYGEVDNDPLAATRTRPDDFDCLADFMGTSQDASHAWTVGTSASDGATLFLVPTDGDPTVWDTTPAYTGLYGIGQYVQHQGYGIESLYSQAIVGGGAFSNGATFGDYTAEIDAGRVVLVQIEGHSMLGYGYDTDGSKVYVRDTWAAGGAYNGGWMPFGGSYDGSQMEELIFFTPMGGGAGVPEPHTAAIFLVGVLAALPALRRRRAAP